MCDELLGSWKLVVNDSKCFEKFMEAIGVNMVIRKTVSSLKPDVIISKNDDEWCIKTVSTFKNSELCFKLNEEFKESTADGRSVMTTITCENGALIQKQRWDDKECTIVREVKEGRLVTTCTYNDVKCVRIYDKKL